MPDFGLVWRAMVDLFPVPIVAIAGLFMTTGFLYFCSLIGHAFGTLQDVYYNRRYNPAYRMTIANWRWVESYINELSINMRNARKTLELNEKTFECLREDIKRLSDQVTLLQLVRKETKLNEVGARGRGLVVEPPVKK